MSQDAQELLRSISDVMFPAEPDTPVLINSVGYDGDTPLHVMAWRNDLNSVELLIRAGADVNALGDMDETPLHIAVHHENVQMAQVLLQAGARSDLRCEFGDTPLERASAKGGEIASLFVDATPPNASLERSLERGSRCQSPRFAVRTHPKS